MTNTRFVLFLKSSSISKESFARVLLNSLNILGVLLTIYGIFWGYKQQIFTSEDALRSLLERMKFSLHQLDLF